MKRYINHIALIFGILLLGYNLSAQGTYFGVKGGLMMGTQNWGGFERQMLLKPQGSIFMESMTEADENAFYASLGYMPRGSALRFRNYNSLFSGNYPSAREFIFYNISLGVGGKQKFDTEIGKYYYLLGVRLEYTYDTNLDQYTDFNNTYGAYAIYPYDDYNFIRRINYGLSVGGGIEIPFSSFVVGFLEVQVDPDFSLQYQQPAIPNVTNPYTGEPTTTQERKIRNLSFMITAGFKFLRKVEYID